MVPRRANENQGRASGIVAPGAKRARDDGRRAFFAVALTVLLLGLAAAWIAMPKAQAAQDDIRYFRIGTAATTGTYFQIGGVLANAISKPPGSRDCERGGSCGVPGLVAIAQATEGSVENVDEVVNGHLESALAQSDIAYWAYSGTGLFAKQPPRHDLRAIAGLFPESIHLVVRADGPIHTLKDLRGKRVSLGEKGSGTLVDAQLVIEAAGLNEHTLKPRYQTLSEAAGALSHGDIDALFLVGGYPVPAIADLAGRTPIRFVPIAGDIADRLVKQYPFFIKDTIPSAAYTGIASPTPTISAKALWVVNASVPEQLVHDITQALWRDANQRMIAAGHPMGQRIKLATTLDGLVIPLHPGAARFYRESGIQAPAQTK